METFKSLSFLLTLPLVAMVLSWLVREGVQRVAAIFMSVLFLGLTVFETSGVLFGASMATVQPWLVEHHLSWVPELGIGLSLKLDVLSAWLVVLNAVVAVVAMSTNGTWYRKNPKLFTTLGFFLVFALNTAFLSTDLITFYLAYEAVFIPVIFMVGIWGENQKATAVFRFFLMSFLGSILMLVSMFYLMQTTAKAGGGWTSNLDDLLKVASTLGPERLLLVFTGFFLAFALKVPVVPFHGWLKEVYVNAPMPATIWMSAILSKLGVYGLIRFVVPLFVGPVKYFQGGLLALSALSVVYAAFLAIRARGPKELLAYSSISHLGFVTLGIFSLSPAGIQAAILLSAGHTLVSALLFYLLHQIEERQGALGLDHPRGLAGSFPILFAVMFGAVLASVSLPGTLNFAGEFLVMLHAYSASALCTIVCGVGVILGAVYMLRFYQYLGLGSLKDTGVAARSGDLGFYEIIVSLGMLGILFVCGFNTAIFLKGI